ncbi:MAG: succinate dehydrogenase, cytochrome b556 subunit [Gammaproteobacteria bacterium]
MLIRPKFLNLTKIHFPVAAVVSIVHRISGVLLSVSLPVLIYLFGLTIRDEHGYTIVVGLIDSIPGKLTLVFLLWNLAHHFLAGIRFLLIDLDIGISKTTAARGAWLVHFGAAGLALLALGLLL